MNDLRRDVANNLQVLRVNADRTLSYIVRPTLLGCSATLDADATSKSRIRVGWQAHPASSMRNTHIEDDTIELYALGRIKAGRELVRIEEHLLICVYANIVFRLKDALITQLRGTLARLRWSRTHLTEDGEVTLFIYLAIDGAVQRPRCRRWRRLWRMAYIFG
jgi:hypothetical protein